MGMNDELVERLLKDEVIEAACFVWLRSLFPPRASEDEVRRRITDRDREHVHFILKGALPAALSAFPLEELVGALRDARGQFEGVQTLIKAMSGRESIAVETAIERIDAVLERVSGLTGLVGGEK